MCPTGSALQNNTKNNQNPNLRSAFEVLDVDGDGKISYEDLRALYGGFSGPGGSDDDVIGSMIALADSNKNGYVEYEEFERVLNGRKKGKDGRAGGGAMEDAFRAMDKDGDGRVGHEDLKSCLDWAGFEAHDEDVKAMITLGGGDENGGVTFEAILTGRPILLLCTFDEETLVHRVDLRDSFESLLNRICMQWSVIEQENISLYYSMPEIPKCVLSCDADFRCMLNLAGSYALERVRVDVFCKKSTGIVSTICNEVLQPLSEESDDNILATFFPSQKKTLKTVGWDNLVTEVGQKFEGGARDFRLALMKYSIETGFEYTYVKNDLTRVTAVCAKRESTGCEWSVHASVEQCNGFFYVRRINNVHTCGSSFRSLKHKRMGSELISNLIIDKVRENKTVRAIDMVKHIGSDYGLNVSYYNAWVGVEKAKNLVYGDQNDSFDLLRSYVDAATQSNPGSFLLLQVDDNSRQFRRIFVSFKASIDGFNHCRPLLFLDGTHLKGKFKGHLLSATGKDGNQGLYPLAFSVVDSENESNWFWFLDCLKSILDPARKVTFISDRNLGLLSAMRQAFPDAGHGYCLNHLKMNLRAQFSGKRFSKSLRSRLEWLLTNCAYAPTVQLYNENMSKLLLEGGKQAVNFLDDLKPENWTNAYFKGNRYGEMTSNAAESFNNWILEERQLPITKMIDAIRVKIMKLFYDRRAMCKEWNATLCPVIDKRLAALTDEARSLTVVGSFDMTYEVQCVPVVLVDIVDRTCTCMQWQINGLPCSHGVACILNDGRRPLSCYVEKYFHVSSYASAYASPIHPVPMMFNDQFVCGPETILPPQTKRMPGRPKKKRYLSRGEHISRLITCSRCGILGHHNRKSCNEPIR